MINTMAYKRCVCRVLTKHCIYARHCTLHPSSLRFNNFSTSNKSHSDEQRFIESNFIKINRNKNFDHLHEFPSAGSFIHTTLPTLNVESVPSYQCNKYDPIRCRLYFLHDLLGVLNVQDGAAKTYQLIKLELEIGALPCIFSLPKLLPNMKLSSTIEFM